MGDRQGRQGTPGPVGPGCGRADPDLSVRRTPGIRLRHTVSGREGTEPGQAADPGGAAHDFPLPPGQGRGAGRTSARAAALFRPFGTALAEAGVDLAVLQALMGHDHVDSSDAYIHLSPAPVRAAYYAARDR